VMELLEGQTLKHLIGGRPLPIDRLVELGVRSPIDEDLLHPEVVPPKGGRPVAIWSSRMPSEKT
jgi:hypothetical protein